MIKLMYLQVVRGLPILKGSFIFQGPFIKKKYVINIPLYQSLLKKNHLLNSETPDRHFEKGGKR